MPKNQKNMARYLFLFNREFGLCPWLSCTTLRLNVRMSEYMLIGSGEHSTQVCTKQHGCGPILLWIYRDNSQ